VGFLWLLPPPKCPHLRLRSNLLMRFAEAVEEGIRDRSIGEAEST
jgi:hypothetical protein